jgi:hypothetical protein
MKVVRLSVLRTDRLYPPETFLLLISVRNFVDLRAIVRPEGLCQFKKSSDTNGNRTRISHILVKKTKRVYSNKHPTRFNVTQFILPGNCSTFFRVVLLPIIKSANNGIYLPLLLSAVTATCRYSGR